MELKLSNATIIDIKDTEQYHSVWQGTFQEHATETMFDITFILSSGDTVELASYGQAYDDPAGLYNYPQVLKYCIDVATSGTLISIEDFISDLALLAHDGVIIKVNNTHKITAAQSYDQDITKEHVVQWKEFLRNHLTKA